MKLIPAIDLKEQQVVYAGGNRHNYPPLKTDVFPSSEPLAVISHLQQQGGFDTFYIADLDAIMQTGSNAAIINDIIHRFPHLTFWLDIGIRNEDDYQAISADVGYIPIVPTETMQQLYLPDESQRHYILSLDFRNQTLLGPADILQQAGQWPATVIALSMNAIGGKGPDFTVIDTVCKLNQHSSIVAGGGIRTEQDLAALQQRGVASVLIANALYTGRISLQQCRQINYREQS